MWEWRQYGGLWALKTTFEHCPNKASIIACRPVSRRETGGLWFAFERWLSDFLFHTDFLMVPFTNCRFNFSQRWYRAKIMATGLEPLPGHGKPRHDASSHGWWNCLRSYWAVKTLRDLCMSCLRRKAGGAPAGLACSEAEFHFIIDDTAVLWHSNWNSPLDYLHIDDTIDHGHYEDKEICWIWQAYGTPGQKVPRRLV